MAGPAQKLRIALLFGGRSAEHDVSVMSATNVARALDPARYDTVPVFVTRAGRWLLSSLVGGLLATPASGTPHELAPIDALFPVLHGPHGEDGSVQGLAEVADVPLVGCGILGSANALDKDIAKRLLNAAGIPAARSVTIRPDAVPSFGELERALGLPVFIKPARQGSSVGVS